MVIWEGDSRRTPHTSSSLVLPYSGTNRFYLFKILGFTCHLRGRREERKEVTKKQRYTYTVEPRSSEPLGNRAVCKSEKFVTLKPLNLSCIMLNWEKRNMSSR